VADHELVRNLVHVAIQDFRNLKDLRNEIRNRPYTKPTATQYSIFLSIVQPTAAVNSYLDTLDTSNT